MAEFDFDYRVMSVKIDKPALDHFLNDPSGAVGAHMNKRGLTFVAAAKAQVGVDTGALRSSIRMIHTRSGKGQYLRIGSDNEIALMHHNGTRPHSINPRQQHGLLRFSAGGRTIYTRHVNHPGTRPNRYLTDNLRVFRR